MKKSDEQINRAIAEQVMAWVSDEHYYRDANGKRKYSIAFGGLNSKKESGEYKKEYRSESNFTYHAHWNPRNDANHAELAMEKYCRASNAGGITWVGINQGEGVEAEGLSHAITDALMQAIEKEVE